ncbi:anti-sigma factor [Gemmatimonas sp. UBA7669]|uniref:anti-sigma factor n=1 Tax=Gemmatimonas sp. UBA7669 TaxID=1946568 RepID=UPI0025C4784B|nr:anti-sigma factor [Gemmatimonas sp. UBA7669]
MTHPSLDALRDLAPGYLLQALTDVERAQFERALRDPALAPELEAELAAHRETFAMLAEGHATPAPPALRERVLARIEAEGKVEARAEAKASAATSQRAAPSATTPVAPAVRAPNTGPRIRWVPALLATALAASAVFAVNLREQVQELELQLSTQALALDSTRQRLAQRESTLQTLTDGGNDLVLVRLTPNTQAGPALQVYWNPRSGKAVIHASGLAPIAEDRAYCLWMIRDGKPVPLTLFRPGSDGSQLLHDITVATGTAGVAAFAVTEEAATGSPVPTMTPFLVGEVKTE